MQRLVSFGGNESTNSSLLTPNNKASSPHRQQLESPISPHTNNNLNHTTSAPTPSSANITTTTTTTTARRRHHRVPIIDTTKLLSLDLRSQIPIMDALLSPTSFEVRCRQKRRDIRAEFADAMEYGREFQQAVDELAEEAERVWEIGPIVLPDADSTGTVNPNKVGWLDEQVEKEEDNDATMWRRNKRGSRDGVGVGAERTSRRTSLDMTRRSSLCSSASGVSGVGGSEEAEGGSLMTPTYPNSSYRGSVVGSTMMSASPSSVGEEVRFAEFDLSNEQQVDGDESMMNVDNGSAVGSAGEEVNFQEFENEFSSRRPSLASSLGAASTADSKRQQQRQPTSPQNSCGVGSAAATSTNKARIIKQNTTTAKKERDEVDQARMAIVQQIRFVQPRSIAPSQLAEVLEATCSVSKSVDVDDDGVMPVAQRLAKPSLSQLLAEQKSMIQGLEEQRPQYEIMMEKSVKALEEQKQATEERMALM